MKLVANEIFGVFEKYKNGECTYDRALEDASRIINKHADEKPIVGYIKGGALKGTLQEIIAKKTVCPDKPYIWICKIHQNEMGNIIRMYESI